MRLGKNFPLNILSFFLFLKTYNALKIFISEKKYNENCLNIQAGFDSCDGTTRELPLRDLYSAFIKLQNNLEITNSSVVLVILDAITEFDFIASNGVQNNEFLYSLGGRNISLAIRSDEKEAIINSKISIKYPIKIVVPTYLSIFNIDLFFNISKDAPLESYQGKKALPI